MIIIFITFVCALLISLLATPLAGRLGVKLGALDIPDSRKVHKRPIPRTGGLGIVVAFFGALAVHSFMTKDVSRELFNYQNMMLLAGGMVVLVTGLFDDWRRLGPKVKLLAQILGATLAYLGGVELSSQLLPWAHGFWLISYGLTVFWFLIFINAVNLIDGLDGLAAGIIFFASLVMVTYLILKQNLLMAVIFASLAGSVLGFLRYNFNPATIFLGDGGSYFLGYALAGLGILGAVKSSLGTAFLIPLVTLGVPVFDTLVSPVRRFILGKRMFQPDKGHIHHRLISMGLSTRRVVMVIYGITVVLCLFGIAIAHARDWRLSLLLIGLSIGAIIMVHKVGYFDYLTKDKLYDWIRDITDTLGLAKHRRSFLSLQIEIQNSATLHELWQNIARCLKMVEFDYGALYLNGNTNVKHAKQMDNLFVKTNKIALQDEATHHDLLPFRTWQEKGFDSKNNSQNVLRLEIPLIGSENECYGILLLKKDMRHNGLNYFTLKRVEQLRSTLISTLDQRRDWKYD